jgi:hypothetical protein
MSHKPLFDSEEGRALFKKMQEGIEELKKLKELTHSEDPVVRKEAIEKLHKAVEKGREYIEKMKKGDYENLARIKELFENPENLAADQVEQKEQIEKQLKGVFSTGPRGEKKKKSSSGLKKKNFNKKWTKS